MRASRSLPFLAVALFAATGEMASAQVPPAPSAPPGEPPAPNALFNADQLPAVHGQMDRLTLAPAGDIDGFLLKDGTEVKTAPALSTQVAYAIRAGDPVTVHGLHAAALPLVLAVSVTDEATHRTVTDGGAPGAGPGPGPGVAPPVPPAGPVPIGPAPRAPDTGREVSGRIKVLLHGPQGEVNGALLDSGTFVRVPPDATAEIASMLRPGQPIVVRGASITNALGTVVDAQTLGTSNDNMVQVK